MSTTDLEQHPFMTSINKSSSSSATALSHVSIVERLMDNMPYGRVHYRMLFLMTLLQGKPNE
jgi:hypothetical protein